MVLYLVTTPGFSCILSPSFPNLIFYSSLYFLPLSICFLPSHLSFHMHPSPFTLISKETTYLNLIYLYSTFTYARSGVVLINCCRQLFFLSSSILWTPNIMQWTKIGVEVLILLYDEIHSYISWMNGEGRKNTDEGRRMMEEKVDVRIDRKEC